MVAMSVGRLSAFQGVSTAAEPNELHEGCPVFRISWNSVGANSVGAASRRVEKQTNGLSEAQVLVSAAAEGRLAVVTRGKKRRQSLHLYMLQVHPQHMSLPHYRSHTVYCACSPGPTVPERRCAAT